MSLNGNLSDFSVLETLQVIAIQRKTGTLEIESGRKRRQLHFDEGQLVGFLSLHPDDPDPLAAAATGLGLCQAEAARRIRATPSRSDTDAGLRELCRLDPELWELFRRLVLQALIDRVLLWDRGQFRFIARSVHPEPGAPWGVEEMLLESMRRLDEAADLNAAGLARKSVPVAERVVPCFDVADPLGALLQRAFLRQSDGSRTLAEIAEILGLAEYDALTTARALQEKRWVRIEGEKRNRPEAQLLLERPRRRGMTGVVLLALLLCGAPALGLGLHRLTVKQSWPPVRRALLQQERFERLSLVQTALEIHHARRGSYPQHLADLVGERLWPAARAAELEVMSYRPEPGEDGYSLHTSR